MEPDKNKLQQIMQPVDNCLKYDLEKLRHEDNVKRASILNQIKNSEAILARESLPGLSQEERTEINADIALANLLLAASAWANKEKNPVIQLFSQKELELVSNFERFNVFDILSSEEIADRMARRKEIYILAMDFYRNEYARLDSILEAHGVRKDLKIAFNKRYRKRLEKVVEGAQAYIAKYGAAETIDQIENTVRQGRAGEKPAGEIEKEKENPYFESKPGKPDSEVANELAAGPKEKMWWQIQRLQLILSIAVMLITLAGLLGWKFGPWSTVSSYTLFTQSVPGNMGTVQISPLPDTNGEYEAGTKVQLEARPASGASFLRWSGDAEGTIPSIVITMEKDKSVTAEFESSVKN